MDIFLPEDKQFYMETNDKNKRLLVTWIEILLFDDAHINKQICFNGNYVDRDNNIIKERIMAICKLEVEDMDDSYKFGFAGI